MDKNPNVAEIELVVRASLLDGVSNGACIFCHEYSMALHHLAQLGKIRLKVTPVDMRRPPAYFRGQNPPLLVTDPDHVADDAGGDDHVAVDDGGDHVASNEPIATYIRKNIDGGRSLFVDDEQADTAISKLYRTFNSMLINDDAVYRKSLLSQLATIDRLLAERSGRFLTGDDLSLFDCRLAPRLQHILVAARHFVNFEIPTELKSLWRYLNDMSSIDCFSQSCPTDQDIISQYTEKLAASNDARRRCSFMATPERRPSSFMAAPVRRPSSFMVATPARRNSAVTGDNIFKKY